MYVFAKRTDMENNTLYQRPLEEIKKLRSEETTIHIQENQTVHLDLPVSAEVLIQLTGVKEHPCYIHFFESDDSALKVIVDPLTETICTDYAHAGYSIMLDPQMMLEIQLPPFVCGKEPLNF